MMPFDISQVRAQFPALQLADQGQPRVYLDNPAGTQIVQRALDRMKDYLVRSNANCGAPSRVSMATDALLAEAHAAVADLLHAGSPDEIVFGPNMTTLTFALSRALGAWLQPGDEIVVTRLDHDANVRPWVRLAEERQAVVKWTDIHPEDCTLDVEHCQSLLTARTRLVAVGYASNLVGTINPVKLLIDWAHAVGAWVFVDAVHYAPHGLIDVQELGADFLVCSPYKFFGPHQGVLWGRYDLLDRLPAYKVRPAYDRPPHKFETGTQSHEGQAGVLGATEYLADLGRQSRAGSEAKSEASGRREALQQTWRALHLHEQELSAHLIRGLQRIPAVKIWGITDPARLEERVPTVAFTHARIAPRALAERLAAADIFATDGHAYAVELVDRLELTETGGVVRLGAVHYNTVQELDRALEVIAEI